MMKRINIIILTGIVFLSLVVSCYTSNGQDQDKVYEQTLQQAYDQADYESICLEPWVKAIEEESNGRLLITIYPGGAIVPVEEMLAGCAAGLVDIAHGGYGAGLVPSADVAAGLPYMYVQKS